MEETPNPNEEMVNQNPPIETPATPKAEEPKLDYKLEHREFLEENDIELKKVPLIIRKKMGIMNMLVKKYQKNPTPSNKNVMIKTDITICDMLQDWKERDYPDNFIEPPASTTPPVAETTTTVETTEEETPAKEVPLTEMENLVYVNLFDGNKIRINVLKSIINQTPNYPIQTVGKFNLRKAWMADYYVII